MESLDNQFDNQKKRPSPYQPVIMAVVLVLGIFIGSNMDTGEFFVMHNSSESNPSKLVSVIDYIDRYYVDDVEKKKIIDDAIVSMLSDLDPHSYYISPEEYQAVAEQMQGNFEGIGVEFMIQDDTLIVVTPLQGGPSEKAGIQPGDRIIEVDGETLSGTGITNQKVMTSLKGVKGSEVEIGIEREGQDSLMYFTLERDEIPIYSVVADFMVDDEVGYIKIVRFARNTYEEFLTAAENLIDKGAKSFVLDFRGNGGGYLDPATRIVEEFIDRGELIVYTKGRSSGEERVVSTRQGSFRDLDVVVLIDQGSASASEVVAGALQDHDRSITVGRRSFGKGLVQNEKAFSDNSAIRLTVARYYTPTGRCIQKPYGDGIDYDGDYLERYESGELLHPDSVDFPDSLRYTTPGGRIVYGGGGIMPDIFVPIDTNVATGFLSHVLYDGLVREFGFNYSEDHREELGQYESLQLFNEKFSIDDSIMADFLEEATQREITYTQEELETSRIELENRIKAYIAKNTFDDQAYYYILLNLDDEFSRAMDVAREYERFFLASLGETVE